MRCEIYGSPTSTHYTQIVGHIADDGNVYNSRSGEAGAEELRTGDDRTIGKNANMASGAPGCFAAYTLAEPAMVGHVRLIFDSDLNRETLPEREY